MVTYKSLFTLNTLKPMKPLLQDVKLTTILNSPKNKYMELFTLSCLFKNGVVLTKGKKIVSNSKAYYLFLKPYFFLS